ncbi:hypothetical protein CHR56_15725 [Rhizobium leguminosarum bv. viciae]|nr:LuxR C-terminal-related transcriptional regulator [Rhizobium leguminosarum]ASS55897.1 hypothetical protein CHR56_15725 [Rhizobium leguminosarum bv. viciae]
MRVVSALEQHDRYKTCPLSPKDTDIVMMLAAGLCRKEIANVMGVSQAAVCQHIQSATKILNLPRKDSALVALAFRSGWVS